MSRMFQCIGKKLSSFFDEDTYNLNRTAVLNVSGDKVSWKLTNELDSNGKIDSSLHVSHSFDKDKLCLETSTNGNPEFSVHTDRIKNTCGSLKLADPTVEIGLKYKTSIIGVKLESSYDWSNNNCDAELSLAYDGLDKFTFGGSGKIERPSSDGQIQFSDYNIGLEFRRNDKQRFSLVTEDQLSLIKLGGVFDIRNRLTGFAQFGLNRKNDNSLDWGLGVRRCLGDNSSLTGLYRANGRGSVLYKTKLQKSHVCAALAFNYDLSKQTDRYSIQYKLVFGQKCCKGKGKQE